MLAKTAGVKHLIVLINKMDDPTVNWSLDRSIKCVFISTMKLMTQLHKLHNKVHFIANILLCLWPFSGILLKEPLSADMRNVKRN